MTAFAVVVAGVVVTTVSVGVIGVVATGSVPPPVAEVPVSGTTGVVDDGAVTLASVGKTVVGVDAVSVGPTVGCVDGAMVAAAVD